MCVCLRMGQLNQFMAVSLIDMTINNRYEGYPILHLGFLSLFYWSGDAWEFAWLPLSPQESWWEVVTWRNRQGSNWSFNLQKSSIFVGSWVLQALLYPFQMKGVTSDLENPWHHFLPRMFSRISTSSTWLDDSWQAGIVGGERMITNVYQCNFCAREHNTKFCTCRALQKIDEFNNCIKLHISYWNW